MLTSGHPYAYFAQVQSKVGAGEMLPESWPSAVRTMSHDLAVVRWMTESAANPTQDPADLWTKCQEYWEGLEQRETLYALILHQGSLWYPDSRSLQFTWKLSLDDVAERAKLLSDADEKAAAHRK